jgi:proline iminopeptidase
MKAFLLILSVFCFISCKPKNETEKESSLSTYFSYREEVESDGVRMIPITTPMGDFKV